MTLSDAFLNTDHLKTGQFRPQTLLSSCCVATNGTTIDDIECIINGT